MTANLTELKAQAAVLTSTIQTIIESKTAPVFCGACYLPAAREDGDHTACCHARPIVRATALVNAKRALANTNKEIRVLEAEAARPAEEKAPKKERKAKSDRKPRERNAEGAITIAFKDYDDNTFTQPNAKAARKFLRKNGLSVHTAVKSGSTWTLPHMPKTLLKKEHQS